MSDRMLTISEAAEEFFVPEKTIRTWIGRGFLFWDKGYLSEAEVARVEEKLRRKPREAQILARNEDLKHHVPQALP